MQNLTEYQCLWGRRRAYDIDQSLILADLISVTPMVAMADTWNETVDLLGGE